MKQYARCGTDRRRLWISYKNYAWLGLSKVFSKSTEILHITIWLSKLVFILCIVAMIMLNKALLKVLQIYFDNFQTDFRGQEVISNPQISDVVFNNEILQFNIATLYKLQSTWMTTYVCI